MEKWRKKGNFNTSKILYVKCEWIYIYWKGYLSRIWKQCYCHTDSSVTNLNSTSHSDLKLGERVIVMSSQGSKAGTLRYIGSTEFAAGEWCGVELDDPLGKNDGSVEGKRWERAKYGMLFCFICLHFNRETSCTGN